jgi:hypothetical protein
VKLPLVTPAVPEGAGLHWENVTPFTVTSVLPKLDAAKSVPSVFTSVVPEIVVADPHVMPAASADRIAMPPSTEADTRDANVANLRTFFIGNFLR